MRHRHVSWYSLCVLISYSMFSSARGRPFTNMASFVFCVEHLPDQRVHPTAHARAAWMDHATNTASDSLKARCKAAMDDFVEIATKHQKPFVVLSKRVAPVEFIFIGKVCYMPFFISNMRSLSHLSIHHTRRKYHFPTASGRDYVDPTRYSQDLPRHREE
jgi:hypothetical protein